MATESDRILVLTVGTGDVTKLPETLLTPLRKSVATNHWTRVILLPSSITEEFAQRLRQGLEGVEMAIRPLPEDAENDADKAYAHFEAVLAETIRHTPPDRVVADFTRGTKAMSAALVLAAARHEIPRLRYITGRRDNRGVVEAGSEDIRELGTTAVASHRRLDLARDLMRRGNFSAAETILPNPDHVSADLYPFGLLEIAKAVRAAAQFYATWDRLAYVTAAQIDVPVSPVNGWAALWPSPAMRDWVKALADEPARSNTPAMAAWLRRLVVDLFANGERRLHQGQHEDALVRAYRVLELVGQARLFDYGLDSGNLNPGHSAVRSLQRELGKKNEGMEKNRDGTFKAGRERAARILKRCQDPLAKQLLDFDQKALLRPTLRNHSLLVHGFTARAPDDPASLRRLFEELAQLIKADNPNDPETVNKRLSVARAPAFREGATD
jgi:CRISPR-associated protein (TIGR02710 family)